jgi:hypothetical protein
VLGDEVAQEPVLSALGEYPFARLGLALVVAVDSVLLSTDLFAKLTAVDVVADPENTTTLRALENAPLLYITSSS